MEEDWISELPDHILEHILCLLTLKEAVRTSILSKRWRRMKMYCILPILDFSNWFHLWKVNSNIRRKNRRLNNVVDKILSGRSHESNPCIKKLYLEVPVGRNIGFTKRSSELKLEKWMKCGAKPGLTELNLQMMFSKPDECYDFPLTTFAALQSLQNLTLMGFQLASYLSYGDIVRFSSLRSLILCDVILDDDVMQKLLKDIPLLEKLEVDGCYGLKVLQVRQKHLKVLNVYGVEGLRKVEIDAPKLEVLKLSPPEDTIFVETSLPCLRKIEIKENADFTLNDMVGFRGMKLVVGEWFSEFLPLCPLLEHLSIDFCYTLHNLNVATTLQALKTLTLGRPENRIGNMVSDIVNVTMIAPNLDKFYITVEQNLPVVELNASEKLEVEIKFLFWDDRNLQDERVANFLGISITLEP